MTNSFLAHTQETVLCFKVDINPGRSKFYGVLSENNNSGRVFLMINGKIVKG